ncbi:MAG: hypothetical protein ACTSXX_14955, partial [Candidatus Baldrarchaeia archaeon]
SGGVHVISLGRIISRSGILRNYDCCFKFAVSENLKLKIIPVSNKDARQWEGIRAERQKGVSKNLSHDKYKFLLHVNGGASRSFMRDDFEHILKELLRRKDELIERDKYRFETGYEWKNFKGAMNVIFNDGNSFGLNADKRLLIFWICCILDRQVPVEKVWNDGVYMTVKFINRGFKPPYPKLRCNEDIYIEKTVNTLSKSEYGGSLARWFINTIRSLKPYGKGTLYRFCYRVFSELLDPSNYYDSYKLKNGEVGLLGRWKRLWMFVMFLKRDNSYIRRLLEAAVRPLPHGDEVLRIWYDENCFSSLECELPVDRRIKEAFEMKFNFRANERKIAELAHIFGEKAGVSPSVLDVMFLSQNR